MGRINLGPKPYSTPQPVWILAAYDENGVANYLYNRTCVKVWC